MDEITVDYGPLGGLIGVWEGDKGMDIAPEDDGSIEENPYYETITFEAAGDLKNANEQHLAMVRYHQVVTRKSTSQVFHDEVGYWIWDADRNTIMRSFTIPRGVCVLAGGEYKNGNTLEVKAEAGAQDWGIVQSPFMIEKAKTVSFHSKINVNKNVLSFYQKTVLEIYGKTFDHTDENELKLIS